MEQLKCIRIGTRGSDLALAQTKRVAARLEEANPGLNIEMVIMRTRGDRILDKPLVDFGGKGVFITEFEEALSQGRIDLAVHSSKDMPMELMEGMTVAGVLPRDDARDVLVTRKNLPLFSEPKSRGVIGTGSLRRQFQLKKIYPDIECISVRGNVTTRLSKLRNEECDGMVLAAAGLKRLGLDNEPDLDYRYFSTDEMIPAGGQGIIAIEGCRDSLAAKLVKGISDRQAEYELETERYILKLLDAGCHEAIGVFTEAFDTQIKISIIAERKCKTYSRQGSSDIENRFALAEKLVSGIPFC